MALKGVDEVIYCKITDIFSHELDVEKLSEYLATLVEKIEDHQERLLELEYKLSRCEDVISESNTDYHDFYR